MNFKKLINPFYILSGILHRFGTHFISNDILYIKLDYFFNMHSKLNLNNPQSFNEKLQWLKIYNKKEYFTQLVDKATVKDFIKEIIGEEYIIPTYGVWNNFENIPFENLPNKFILKCTHDSGGIVICKNKNDFNKEQAKIKINHCLQKNYYLEHREYPYKNVVPRIIAEKLLETADIDGVKDYKFMCFHGVCKMVFVCSNRSKQNVNIDFFDTQWNHLPFKRHYQNSPYPIKKPKNLEKMISIVEKIANKIETPFIRIDLYEILNKIYFGEVTFFPGAGLEEFDPKEWDYKIGRWINLSVLNK